MSNSINLKTLRKCKQPFMLLQNCLSHCKLHCYSCTKGATDNVSSFLSDLRTGAELRPCFSKILARTTFVLESLCEAKYPGQDAFLADFVFRSSELMINSDYW